jgi:hypothetical protein
MYTIESGETPSRILKWIPLGFLSHIKRRTIGDRFPLSLWEVWFSSTLGVSIPALIGPSQRCNTFDYDVHGDHLQTCLVLQKPQEQADRLPPPRTLILDFTQDDSYTIWKITLES